MSNTNKKAVKRLAPKNAQDSCKAIELAVKKHNLLYGGADSTKLVLMTEADHMIEGAKIMSYTDQYYFDIANIALYRAFGFAAERQERFRKAVCDTEEEYRSMKKADLADDPDAWYTLQKMEEELALACGKYYEPRAKRYHATFLYNGTEWDELNVTQADARMTQLRGEMVRDDTNK